VRLILVFLFGITLWAQERIVTLAPAAAEIVAALGAADAVVAVSDYTLYPPELAARPSVGGYLSITPETVLSHQPTLAVGMVYQRRLLERLRRLGVDTVALRLDTVAAIEKSIRDVARKLGRNAEGKALVDAIESAAASAAKHPAAPQKVLIVFGGATSLARGVYAAGPRLFYDEILRLCGTENALSDTAFAQPVLTPEQIIASDPDTVVILYGPRDRFDAEAVRRAWERLPVSAARKKRIFLLQSDYLLIPGPRIGRTIETLCGVLK